MIQEEKGGIPPSPFGPSPNRPDPIRMTAMKNIRNADSGTDLNINSNRPKSMNDRKFAFLNNITRPDYRSLPASVATSQSSVPSTPISVPEVIRNVADEAIFSEFGAPIATPEDEQIDDLEMRSEPLLSPRRTFDDFVEFSKEKENVKECDEAEHMIIEVHEKIVEDINKEKINEGHIEESEMVSGIKNEDNPLVENDKESLTSETVKIENNSESDSEVQRKSSQIEEIGVEIESEKASVSQSLDSGKDSESKKELKDEEVSTPSSEQSIIDEEIRQMTESFGEPRKAVLERVDDTIEHCEEDEEEQKKDGGGIVTTKQETNTHLLSGFHLDSKNGETDDSEMVFGWHSKSKTSTSNSCGKPDKPNSLALSPPSEEPECSDKKRAEFQINIDEDEIDDLQQPLMTSFGDEGLLQQSLLQLQKQLRKSDVRCSRLEKICEFQQKDIESLRFEMDWKDKRIEYLQKTLQEMESNSAVTITTKEPEVQE